MSDRIARAIVSSIAARYPDESDQQLFDRIVRASRSAGNPEAEIPLTVEAVSRLRGEAAS
ncbi:hypothetical protein Ade02nite_20400 [Paractinoplanes deccanensis]|uniref:Uncharacterized protein n=1 Tax=Paractinoplanes deccanensis TaxID=113561 RepID=A0ABQ3Y072_9ACTN|nr:hypothetical protein [Actinoplanes deccanensis]GID73399.1 hypothetical protein Ade02nite_20400 [Actinoplanes deccanensis]